MRDSEILIAARKLIEKPDNWCKGNLALDDMDEPRDPTDPLAQRFCSVGAVIKADRVPFDEQDNYISDEDTPLKFLRAAAGAFLFLGNWNDLRTHAEVLSAFDKAIGLAEAEETHAS